MGAGRVRGVVAATVLVALLVVSPAAPASPATAGFDAGGGAAAIVDGWTVEQQIAQMVLFEVEIDNLRLRRENRVLRMEKEILGKAAAFFATENGHRPS